MMKGGQMGTHCSDVFDLFTMLQSDYRMDTLYEAQGTAGLNIYLEPWLLFSINEFDSRQQSQWFIPSNYRDMDIAEHVLGLCSTQAERQRCGEELVMCQERNWFDLWRYLKYFVDTMNIITKKSGQRTKVKITIM
jgi:hypothetical protein